MEDRFNTPHTSAIEVEMLGHSLHIAQDPNSRHLGTTVWDSSLVFLKFLERNSRKGEFSRAKLAGKRVVELGAGCGLAGLGMALLGCKVVMTDQVAVLPLLLRNSERNMARAKYTASENPLLGTVGSVEVAELDWGNLQQIAALEPPYDYIVGTDVVYKDQLLEPLLQTMAALSGPKTKVLLGYEFRASEVHEKLEKLFKERFLVKKVQKSKMDAKYQHPNIDLFILAPQPKVEEVAETLAAASLSDSDDGLEECANAICRRDAAWETRRMGAKAARLLNAVSVPEPCTAKDL